MKKLLIESNGSVTSGSLFHFVNPASVRGFGVAFLHKIFRLNKYALVAIFVAVLMAQLPAMAQLDVAACPMLEKRSNGNGQANSAPGIFPGYGIDNPVAPNVVGTTYQTVPYDPATKTGNLNFRWTSATPVDNLPVITRAFLTTDGAFPVTTLSPIKFGPPPPATVSGQYWYVSYSFYVQNLPPSGKVTLEFSDPRTNQPAFTCTYDLQNNSSASTPAINCAPTITTQPSNVSVCGASTASLSVVASGAVSYQWQVNNSGNWTTVTDGSTFSGAATSVLTITNPASLDGKQFRVIAVGSGTCGNTTSNTVTLVAKPKPTATFATTSYCGIGTRSIAVNFTGTPPWSFSYAATPLGGNASVTTVSNISSSPYYFAVTPAVTTTYAFTNVADAYCSNNSFSSGGSTTVYATPSITPSNATTCVGSDRFSLSYTATGSPDRYSISTGVRAMAGFAAVSNATMGASPLSITIPNNAAAGTYDFNLTVSNSVTGCVSSVVPFTVTVRANPLVGATASGTTVCAGSTVTLTASPAGLSIYSWIEAANPATVISTSQAPVVTVNTSGSYTVTGTDAFGCSASANVAVTAVAGPTLTITPNAPTICSGNAVSLSVSGGNTYSWSPAATLSASSGDLVVASPATTTTYTVTSQNLTGCQSVGTVTVTVSIPDITVTPSATICAGNIQTLTASGGSTYKWYPATGLYTNAGATVAYVAGTNASTVYAKPTSTTTYYVEGTTSGGCSGVASSTVSIAAAPINTATSTGNNLVFCTQGTSSFDLVVNTTTAVTSMSWSYSTDALSYTNLTGTTTVGGITFTPTTSTTNATLNITGYGNSAYSGARYFRVNIVGSSCTFQYDILVTDTKGTTPAAPTASATTICNGNSTTLSAGSLATGTLIQWESSTTSATTGFTAINGATSTPYTVNPTTNTYYRVLYSKSGGANCNGTSSATLITVAAAPGANTVSPASSCTNGSSTITLDGSAMSGTTYQWERSTTSSSSGFTAILGATAEDYTLPYNIVPSTYYFRRVAYPGNCSPTTSTAVAVYAPISNNQITNSSTSYCVSATATLLNASTPTGGSGTYSYQWRISSDGTNFSDISGATSATYTTLVVAATRYYQRVVTSGGCSDVSSTFVIPVYSNPTVNATAGSTNLCSGSSTGLTATGANTYAWSPATDLSATTGAAVVATPSVTRTYTVTGTDLNGCSSSAQVTLNVTALPANPTLSAGSQTICSGTIDLTSKVTSGGTTSWYRAPEVNATYAVATPSAVGSAGTYYVFAQSGSCYSAGYQAFTLSVSDVSKPVVAATSASYCAPATADLKALMPVAPSGVSLEWHTVAANPTTGSKVATPEAVGTGTYYLYGYSTAGACYGQASDAVAITINNLPVPSLSGTNATVCAPATIDLTVYNNTVGTNTYTWYSANSATPDNLVAMPTAVASSGSYYLAATSAAGCRSNLSSAFTATVNPKPTAGISAPSAACGSVSRTIVATSNASSPVYQWQMSSDASNWSNVPESGVYSGTGTNTLTIANVSGLGGMYYRYSVTSGSGCINTSDAAVLVVESSPAIVTSPSNVTTTPLNDVQFSVVISGSATAEVQWQMSTDGGNSYTDISDGTDYYGTNNTTLVVKNVSLIQNGSKFRAKVYNTCEAGLLSAPATLAVGDIDTDGDGIMDGNDLDDDNDGVTDAVEAAGCAPSDPDCDSDGDGIPNRVDLDSDNDGIPDVIENGGADANGDGRIDNFKDIDADGLTDQVDANTSGAGSSGNGLTVLDTDGDGIPNYLDLDSDGDGIPDLVEAGGTDTNNDGKVDVATDTDNDGLADAVDGDTGNDGVVENLNKVLLTTGTDTNADGKADSYPNGNADASGLPNFLDLDSDGDGITDVREAGLTDSNGDGLADGADANGDGWSDAIDALPALSLPNTDLAGRADYLDIDSDDDGIPDNIEAQTTSGYIAPLGTDADSDGIDDAYDNNDAVFGGNGNNGLLPVDTDTDGTPDYQDMDSDGDGRTDRVEGWDMNGNGIIDGAEVAYTGSSDLDGDGLLDEYDNDDAHPNPTNGSTPAAYSDAQKPGGNRDWREDLQRITIAGNVFNDANGNKEKANNENNVNGTNTGAGVVSGEVLYINFIDAYGKVAAGGTVNADGSFSFDIVPAKGANLVFQLTTVQGVLGSAKPATLLPAGWVSTGANKFNYDGDNTSYDGAELTFTAGEIGSSSFLFGMNRKPTATPQSEIFGGTLKIGQLYSLDNTPLSGTDAEDGTLETGSSFKITSLPPAEDDVTLFYNNSQLIVGSVISNYDPMKLAVRFNSNAINRKPPGAMQTLSNGETSFMYQSLDAASTLSDPATYTIMVTNILPVTGLQLNGNRTGNSIQLNWTTQQEFGTRKFVVERSVDSRQFYPIGEVKANGNSLSPKSYQFADVAQLTVLYYRVAAKDADGQSTYSNVISLRKASGSKMISVYPNPVQREAWVSIAEKGKYQLTLTNAAGANLWTRSVVSDAGGASSRIPRGELPPGIYWLQVTNSETGVIWTEKLLFE